MLIQSCFRNLRTTTNRIIKLTSIKISSPMPASDPNVARSEPVSPDVMDAADENLTNKPTQPPRTSKKKKMHPNYDQRRLEPPRVAPTNLSEQELEDRKSRRLGRKQKVALLLGFCGTGYQGMQININAKTIEGELFKALVKAKCVSEDNATDLKKIGFQRACRTDKGVHAIGNLVSCKLVIEHLADPVTTINSHLPPEIRVWDLVRVINSFDAKNHTDHRSYQYLLPTYVLSPVADWEEITAGAGPVKRERDAPETEIPPPENYSSYRISAEQLDQLRTIFQKFIGTHNHHCFTVKKNARDPSAMRYITKFKVSDPFVYTSDNYCSSEWVSITIQGQSFLLHQIRKMVGLAVMLIKTNTPVVPLVPDLLSGKSVKVNVPKAPSLGLLLRNPVYEVYNGRIMDHPEDRQPIEFVHDGKVNQFKQDMIYNQIIRQESQTKEFHVWFQLLKMYPYAFRYFNKEGRIPEGYTCVDGVDDDEAAGFGKDEAD